MNTWDKCKNCGGERGLHHYETDQCPFGGCEAPIGQEQIWKMTTFEIDESDKDDIISAQAARIAELKNNNIALLACAFDCEDCEATGLDDGDACHTCGGYGFVVSGDIHEVVMTARELVSK